MVLATLVKQPGETLRRAVSFDTAAAIVAPGAVTVVVRGLVAGGTGLQAVAQLVAGELAVTLSGGADGERYLVTVRATDAAGAALESELDVAVVEAGWALPDGGAPALSIVDFVERFGFAEVVRMTDGDGAGRIDRQLLTRALADAQAVADAHLAARYALPLATVPPIVQLAIADIARARLYPRGAPDGVADAAKTAQAYLTRIQSGALQLDLPATAAPPAPAGADGVLISPGRTRYRDPAGGESY